MDLKIAVMNFSGNVGKSTLSALLASHFGAPLIAVETLNGDDHGKAGDIVRLRADEYGRLQDGVINVNSVVVDVGSSNAAEFLKRMTQYEGSQEEFDYFVVPVVKEPKQQDDTVNTIITLAGLGVQKRRILLVMNQVDVHDDIHRVFGGLESMAQSTNSFVFNEHAVLYQNELFRELKAWGVTVADLLRDETDWRSKVRNAVDPEERMRATRMISLKRLAASVSRNADALFQTLFARHDSKETEPT